MAHTSNIRFIQDSVVVVVMWQVFLTRLVRVALSRVVHGGLVAEFGTAVDILRHDAGVTVGVVALMCKVWPCRVVGFVGSSISFSLLEVVCVGDIVGVAVSVGGAGVPVPWTVVVSAWPVVVGVVVVC